MKRLPKIFNVNCHTSDCYNELQSLIDLIAGHINTIFQQNVDSIEVVNRFMPLLNENKGIMDKEIQLLDKYVFRNLTEIKQDLNTTYHQEFLKVEENLEEIKSQLMDLSNEIITLINNLKDYSETSSIQTLKWQLNTFKGFMVNILLPKFQKLDSEYKKALVKLEAFAPKFFVITQEMKPLLDKGSDEYASWASDLRAAVYTPTGAGTTTCIVLDALLITWGKFTNFTARWPYVCVFSFRTTIS